VARIRPVSYKGKIWCIRVATGSFVAVRNGKAFPTGNSGFPKNKAQLKPAFEPIICAYRPGGKRRLNIDECRISTNGEDMGDPHRFAKLREHEGWDRPGHTPDHIAARGDRAFAAAKTLGRWPADVCHDGSDEVLEAFAAFGELRSGSRKEGHYQPLGFYANTIGRRPPGMERGMPALHGDAGTAARFFYCAKASKVDRAGSKHPTVKPQALLRWLVALVTPPGGTVLDCFAGSGSLGQAALAVGRKPILIEREAEYFEDIKRRIANCTEQERHSSCVKKQSRSDQEVLPLFAETHRSS
jgi:site-specific DNA-methyltransferase (adenine-specific)